VRLWHDGRRPASEEGPVDSGPGDRCAADDQG
jgi:hypothetical protein